LQPEEVAGCYPANNSTTSPEEYLPHIVLRRRTLPWERSAKLVAGDDETPWMALVLLDEDELIPVLDPKSGRRQKIQSITLADFGQIDGATHATLLGAGYKDTDPSQLPSPLDFICADRKVLLDVLPKPNELPLLCHVQRLLLEPDET